jgi:hypothetical protein
MQQHSTTLNRYLLLILSAYLLAVSTVQFWNITWGTGEWLGQFSLRWGFAFLIFVLFCIVILIGVWFALFDPDRLNALARAFLALRQRLGFARWLLVLILLIFPVWLLQHTAWGIIMDEPTLRLLLWALSAVLTGYLLTSDQQKILGWPGLLTSLILTAAAIKLASAVAYVTSYPFSLGWSEGNRLWDYSVLFGRRLYNYPADEPILVLLDIGRQFVGGVPFLIPGLTIWQERLWVALMNILPYLLLGWIAFKLPGKISLGSTVFSGKPKTSATNFANASRTNFFGPFAKIRAIRGKETVLHTASFPPKQESLSPLYWILGGIWAYMFVEQGPVHPPLLLCAILVAFAWRKPLWLAIPLILVASYFAEVSRFTWLFAPGMWAGMLELSSAELSNGRLDKTAWTRAISVGLAGVIGGYLAPFFVPSLVSWFVALVGGSGSDVVSSLGTGVTLSAVESESASQALLWYRLFPNATYDYGILIGLLLAVGPLIVVLVYLSVTRRWVLNTWQKLAILLPLLAFLVVGLIVSVKIGGGGDLHNMDMFILGVMFAGAIAWRNGGYEWVRRISDSLGWVRAVAVLLIVLPAFQSLVGLMPISIDEDMRWVMTLADIPPTGPMPELLPSEADTQKSLNDIRDEVERAASQGEVLFMDQRQLLTFGYVKNVPLIPDYDKKVLINQAMSANASYFSEFYEDLAARRFSLIITNPLHEKIQTGLNQFGEENNAWVTWVSTPVLCYYEPVNTLKKVTVQLLVPRQDTSGCEQRLPVTSR